MKFRFYITSLPDGNIQGTDNAEYAENFAASEDFFVVDSSTGEWITAGSREDIQEVDS